MKCWINGTNCVHSSLTEEGRGILSAVDCRCGECGVFGLNQEEIDSALEKTGVKLVEEQVIGELDQIAIKENAETILLILATMRIIIDIRRAVSVSDFAVVSAELTSSYKFLEVISGGAVNSSNYMKVADKYALKFTDTDIDMDFGAVVKFIIKKLVTYLKEDYPGWTDNIIALEDVFKSLND